MALFNIIPRFLDLINKFTGQMCLLGVSFNKEFVWIGVPGADPEDRQEKDGGKRCRRKIPQRYIVKTAVKQSQNGKSTYTRLTFAAVESVGLKLLIKKE